MQQFVRWVVIGFSSFCGQAAIGQWATIGSIDVYGNRKTSGSLVRQQLKLAAGDSVEREMKAMKAGKLRSGRGGNLVTNPKQAIAIGLSEARKAGKKVPPPKSS